MANVVPDRDEIATLPTPLTDGERQILDTLEKAYIHDSNVTIYVQPHLNGLNPDFVLFSEDAGVVVIEAKDWNLAHYEITLSEEVDDGSFKKSDKKSLDWKVYDRHTGQHVDIKCPFDQVERYKNSIIDHEVPAIRARIIVDGNSFYGLIKTVVAFTKATCKQLDYKLGEFSHYNQHKYRYMGIEQCTNPEEMRDFLNRCGFRKGSSFTSWMRKTGFSSRLRNALGYPEHGNYSIKHLTIQLSEKQKQLLDNELGTSRRVKGVAGSGKTMIIVQKAVNAALAGHKVLVVCFNITMANHLQELCTRLARHYNRHANRHIEVGHYHRFFKLNTNEERRDSGGFYLGYYQVLLIDEGQDFQRLWIEKLQEKLLKPYHFFFVEDERQDIYNVINVRGPQVPGIRGRPNILDRSYRLPNKVIQLANSFAEEMKLETDTLDIDSTQYTLPGIGDDYVNERKPGKIVYASGSKSAMLIALCEDLSQSWDGGELNALADNAILVASVPDGWEINSILERLQIPVIRTFESEEEYLALTANDKNHENTEIVNMKSTLEYRVNDQVEGLRRAYKVAFRMKTGKVKLSTIHSFKGWELKRIFIFFNATKRQLSRQHHLFYTAITRCYDELYIYDCNENYSEFFNKMISKNIVEPRKVPLIPF